MELAVLTVCKRLKSETLSAHQETEKALMSKLRNINSKRDYIALLKLFYGFYAPTDNLVRRYITPEILSDIDRRRPSDRIEDDLRALHDTGLTPTSYFVPRITSLPQAFGAKYVIEGSTLGGQIIARMIANNPNIDGATNITNFFSGYGSESMQMWRTFQQKMEQIFQTTADQNAVIASADETFQKMRAWLLLN